MTAPATRSLAPRLAPAGERPQSLRGKRAPLTFLEALAARHYDPELPYHNVGHALRAAATGRALVAEYMEAGVDVRADVVDAALLFHDAGYRIDPASVGCATREEVAAGLADADLARYGWDAPSRSAVVAAILATHHDAVPATLEARIVRAADLAGMSGSYDQFVRDTDNLRAEAVMLGAAPVTDLEWANQVMRVIGWYLGNETDISTPGAHRDGLSRFHRGAYANVHRYARALAAAA